MNSKQVLSELKKMGTAQNRKIYERHGVSGEMFGVSYANLAKLVKSIKTNHDVAVGLWESGIHDAQVLATMVADPAKMKKSDANRWSKKISSYVLADAFGKLLSQTEFAIDKSDQWINSKNEWTSAVGWTVLNQVILNTDQVSDSLAKRYLKKIEEQIYTAKNRTRYSMNNCLIAIGLQNPTLQKLAIASARRIGPVDVDHGQTSCQTPDAETYIKKTAAHRKKKAAAKKRK